MRVLIDTCVIIDALQHRKPFCQSAEKIFLLAANQKFEGFISAKSSTDIFYVTFRNVHDTARTRNILHRVLQIFELLDTMAIDCKSALFLELTLDYEDAIMIETAKRSGMDYIVTRNIKDYSKSTVPVLVPDEFLQKFQESEHESDSKG